MAQLTIADLPFVERPLRELLHLDADRDAPSPAYSGFGWARAPEVWLESEAGDAPARRVADAVIVAAHTADDGERLADDLELEFELADRAVTVLASAFLARWLPRLPHDRAIVLAVCNPHRAVLPRPPAATVPVHHAIGDVASWRDRGGDGSPDRIILTAEAWCTL